VRRPEELSFGERLYIPEILRGMAVTGGKFWRNLGLHVAHACGWKRDVEAAVTLPYPEVYQNYGPEYRGSHRLTLKEDGSMRCTSCFLCATACPARCIHIEAGELPDSTVEKYAVRYEIDTLRCIFCGMCVEACPCDAIRMDTSVHPRIAGYRRSDFIEDKQVLMGRSRVLEERGRGAIMQDMLAEYRKAG